MTYKDMTQPDTETPIKNLSEDEFQSALQDAIGISEHEAAKLVRMYKNFSTGDGEETLGEVINNIEINDDIQVRQGNSF